MTAPPPPHAQPLPIQQQSWAHDAALLAIETAVTAMITRRLLSQLRGAVTSVTRAWITMVGPLSAKPQGPTYVRPMIELAMSLLDNVADETLLALTPLGDGVRAAYVLGLRQAGAPRRVGGLTPAVTLDMPAVVHHQLIKSEMFEQRVPTAEELIRARERKRIAAALRDEIEQAKKLLTVDSVTEKGFTQMQVALARAAKLEQRVEAAVAWHLLYANQQAVTDTARRRRLDLIWVSERDACVVCLALNGDVVAPGDSFDVAATYGDPDKVPDVWPDAELLPHPPRHNRCRCRCEIHDSERSAGLVDALKRESNRAIVYGWRTDSESGEVRRHAAEKLLAKGVNLPESVKHRGEIRIKEPGTFGGPVPEPS